MKKILSVLLVLTVISCNKQLYNRQTNYFQPEDIIYRSDEFTDNNNWITLGDKESLGGYTRIGDSIFGGEINCNIKPLKDIDVESFKVLAGTEYAKDKNFVYYPTGVFCVDYTDCGVCYYKDVIVENANPESFQLIEKDYSKDDQHIYFRGELLSGADESSFKVIDGPAFFYFAKDKNHVYKHGEIFKDADPETFYFEKENPENIISTYDHKFIIRDKDNVWEFIPPNKIKKIDPK